jgi:RNA polymerase sigma factor (sigma-70 family)
MRAWAASEAVSPEQVDASSRAAERLTSLYEAYAADAFRYALHLTGRREDAEDVVQHVFLQAYAMFEAGRDLASPRAWVMKATKHRSLNMIRDRRDAPVGDIDPATGSTPPGGETEALAEVRAVLWSLPQTQHHAFVLRHWSGLSQDEIADVLATTPHAVEALLVRARAALVAERDAGDPECAGVRRRLARMLAPTPAQTAHVAECRRCRTAQSRLLRASGHAAAFALVPGPGSQVLNTLAAAAPGFGASGAAVTAASAATKAGLVSKIALAATTAAVAVTAVHPLRSAVTHTILHDGPAPAAAAPAAATPRARPAPEAVAARTPASRPAPVVPAASASDGGARRRQASAPRAVRGKSAAARTKTRPPRGRSASAPGHTKAPGSHAASGRGVGMAHANNGRSQEHAAARSGGRHKGK